MSRIGIIHAFWILTANALVHEVGIPVPILPTALILGAHAVHDPADFVLLVCAIAIGTVLGNAVWFAAGRRYGHRVLDFLCRFSLTAATCVSRTEKSFGRWGAWALVVGRFIPGVSLVAAPLAAAVGMSWRKFVALTIAGAVLYSVVALSAGLIFRHQIATLMRALEALGWQLLAVAVALVAVYVAWRWWRRRVGLASDLARVSVDELKGMISGGDKPLIVDVRGSTTLKIDPRQIPDAMPVSLETIEDNRDQLPRDRKIVLYCACPNEATAAKAARLLLARGYGWVRPLTGGLDAWNAALGQAAAPALAAAQLSPPPTL